tara:strand:+ start:791 stop:928 length:138 start_codon:yes stop_codon:yes gene_type:complete
MKIKTKVFKWNELKQKTEVVVSYIDTTKLMTKEQVRINQLKKEQV